MPCPETMARIMETAEPSVIVAYNALDDRFDQLTQERFDAIMSAHQAIISFRIAILNAEEEFKATRREALKQETSK